VDRARRSLEKVGIPGGDVYELPSSAVTFPDGANYRIEISGIERLSTLEALVDEMHRTGAVVHRVISTVQGSTLLTTDELKRFARTAAEARLEVIITPGPRPQWDVGKQVATPEGAVSGMRIRGCDNLRYLLSDIYRCLDLGFRGFLVWDEGALSVLAELREKGDIPKDTVFKVSIYAGHANPAGARVLKALGADTFNPIADLTLPMFAAVRKVVDLPMDVHVYLFDSFGGHNRMWECAEIARVCSPCYFKIEPGPSVSTLYKPWTSEDSLAAMARDKVRYGMTIKEMIDSINPGLKLSPQGPEDLSVPKP